MADTKGQVDWLAITKAALDADEWHDSIATRPVAEALRTTFEPLVKAAEAMLLWAGNNPHHVPSAALRTALDGLPKVGG